MTQSKGNRPQDGTGRSGFAESDLGRAFSACKSSFLYAGFFSLFVNLLLLVP